MAIKVLLVEDSRPDAIQLRNALGHACADECSLTQAESARQAVARLGHESFDAILLDLSLPDSRGLATIERIHAATPSTPIVVLTGQADEKAAKEAVRAGAQDYLVKGEADGRSIVRALRYAIDRAAAEKTRRLSEIWFRAIYERAPVGIALLDSRTGRFLQANPRYCEIVGRTQEEILTCDFKGLTHPEDLPAELENLARLVQGRIRFFNSEKRDMRPDRSWVWVSQTAVPMWAEGEAAGCYITIVENITERKRAEERSRDYQAKLRRLASELSLTEERERRNLAADLHDNTSQLLSVAKIRLGELVDAAPAPLKPALRQVADLLGESVSHVRSLTFQLSPPILQELGLKAALASLADHMRDRFKYQVVVEDNGQPKPLDADARGMLFRAVRELLINIGKHAKASKVRIQLHCEDSRLAITVEDNGVGFDAAKALVPREDRPCFGLFSIRERLSCLEGEMSIESVIGQGTRVRLLMPIEPREGT